MIVSDLSPEDWDQALALVASAGLPTSDLSPGRQRFWGAWEGGRLVGVAAWEKAGKEALARSFAVVPEFRGKGVGTGLYANLEETARKEGLSQLVLLTETAEVFFSRLGWSRISREDLSPAIRSTAEFSDLCPVSAAVLHKVL